MRYLNYYLLLLNAAAFIMMGIDKRKAIKHRWRISEGTLLFTALIGGAAGIGLGMLLFHHKTKHLKFTLGVPFLLVLNAAALWYLLGLLKP